MYLKADTLDDLLHRSFKLLLATKGRQVRSTRGVNFERTGVLLNLTNPRARLSRSSRRSQFFSALGELAWYLAGSKSLSFIKYYITAYAKEEDRERALSSGFQIYLAKPIELRELVSVVAPAARRDF